MTRHFLLAALACAGLLHGCASVTHAPGGITTPGQAPEEAGSTYRSEPGRDATTIAEMRAGPAPDTPAVDVGSSMAGDHKRLTSQGFVRVGTARYSGSEDGVRNEADREARAVGAERVLVYPPNQASAYWNAMFYVRFKLPFGATFRDLTTAERGKLGGGVQIGSVVGGTPASRANLIAGDFVVKVNGREIGNKAAFQDELRANAGHSVTLTIVRNGETQQRVVRLGSLGEGGAR